MDTPTNEVAATLRPRMAVALRQAMKDRDRVAVSALRSSLAVLANAEAVPVTTPARVGLGVGSTDVARAGLTDLETVALVTEEAAEREQAASTYDAVGDVARARRLRAEAEVIRAFLA